MAKPNVSTCPKCGARAHKMQLSWWQRFVFIGKSRYFCNACKHRFSSP